MQSSVVPLFVVLLSGSLASIGGCTLVVDGSRYVRSGTGFNERPVVRGVSLSSYNVVPGEQLVASVAVVEDAEGDPATPHYRWLRGAGELVVVPDATTNVLDTTGFSPADQIRVEVWASDEGGDGMSTSASARVVDTSTPFWIPRLPHEDGTPPLLVSDPASLRVLRLVEGSMWEYALTGAGLRETSLAVTEFSPPVPVGPVQVIPSSTGAVFLFTGADRDAVYVTWTESRDSGAYRCPTTGTPPVAAVLSGTIVDRLAGRTLLVGGLEPETQIAGSSIVALQTPGGGCTTPSWESVLVSGDPLPSIFGSVAVLDPSRTDRAFVIGGATTTAPGRYAPVRTVFQLDLSGADVVVTDLGIAPPVDFFRSAVIRDSVTGRLLIVGGTDGPTGRPLLGGYVFDTERLQFSVLTGSVPPAVAPAIMPFGDRPGHYLVFGGLPLDAASEGTGVVAHHIYTDETSIGGDEVGRAAHPTSLTGAIASAYYQRLFLTQPQRTDGAPRTAGTWELATPAADPETGGWTFEWRPLTGDATTAALPAGRDGVLVPLFWNSEIPMWMAGGRDAGGTLLDMTPWELGTRADRWTEHTLSGASPPPREGHVVFTSPCEGAYAVGGTDGSTFFGEVLHTDCSAGPRACTWTVESHPEVAVAWPAFVLGSPGAMLFGGRDASGLTNALWALPTCTGVPFALPATGTPPSPRERGTAAWNDDAGTLWIFGGDDGSGPLGDLYVLAIDGGGGGVWSEVVTRPALPRPSARVGATTAPTPHGFALIGGDGRTDVWELAAR